MPALGWVGKVVAVPCDGDDNVVAAGWSGFAAREASAVTAVMPVTTVGRGERVGLAGERGQRGGDLGEAGADIG